MGEGRRRVKGGEGVNVGERGKGGDGVKNRTIFVKT